MKEEKVWEEKERDWELMVEGLKRDLKKTKDRVSPALTDGERKGWIVTNVCSSRRVTRSRRTRSPRLELRLGSARNSRNGTMSSTNRSRRRRGSRQS